MYFLVRYGEKEIGRGVVLPQGMLYAYILFFQVHGDVGSDHNGRLLLSVHTQFETTFLHAWGVVGTSCQNGLLIYDPEYLLQGLFGKRYTVCHHGF